MHTIPWAFTEDMSLGLYWCTTSASYSVLWEEVKVIFSGGGMVCDSSHKPTDEGRIILQGSEESIAGSVPCAWQDRLFTTFQY